MHGNWESETGHHTLAHKISSDDREEGTTNLEWILNNWISLGADPAKLNIGLAAFGCSFALVDPDDHGYLAPATFITSGTIPVLLEPEAGNFTDSPGFLSHPESTVKWFFKIFIKPSISVSFLRQVLSR